MEDDLAKDEIVLKEKKPRSEAQIKAFEKAREIRLENSKIKKEKIAEVKEQVKNRNKVGELKVPPTTPSLPVEVQKKERVNIQSGYTLRENVVLSDEEPEVVIVKKKKKPKVIYMEESDEEPEPQIVKKKKDPVVQPVLAKPIQSIRFF
jgi:phosphatidylinositol kinase/protein kinase (PI-3  family)